ncbi:MAG: hypothetical protein J7J72_00605, partial [Bacteroidales bacterium]|nr:hypothetical protein [Bacteroidales bacterium]
IKYPTDINLLSIGRENLERMIDLLYNANKVEKKPRDYRRKARHRTLEDHHKSLLTTEMDVRQQKEKGS